VVEDTCVIEELSEFLSKGPAWIWGAGLLGRSLYSVLKRNGLSGQVAGFIDSNPTVQGRSFLGVPVEGAAAIGPRGRVIVAAAKNVEAIYHRLVDSAEAGSENVFDINRYPELGHWSIEIVGACNLKCPSCPRGNFGTVAGKRVMRPERFAAIVDHIAKIDRGTSYVAIYNWGDTLLHPNLKEILDILNERLFYIAASSNLSMPKPNLETIAQELRCGELRISLSGFTQEVYGRSHRGGDIELVKSNMRQLRACLDAAGNHDIQVKVVYHVYKHNAHEVSLMKEFAESLGFVFDPIKAILFPVEHMMDYLDKGCSSSEDFNNMAEYMLEPLRQVLRRGSPHSICKFWKQNNIDVDGAVTLCCITFDRTRNTIAHDVLAEGSVGALLARKRSHPMCSGCMSHSIDQFVWGDLWV